MGLVWIYYFRLKCVAALWAGGASGGLGGGGGGRVGGICFNPCFFLRLVPLLVLMLTGLVSLPFSLLTPPRSPSPSSPPISPRCHCFDHCCGYDFYAICNQNIRVDILSEEIFVEDIVERMPEKRVQIQAMNWGKQPPQQEENCVY